MKGGMPNELLVTSNGIFEYIRMQVSILIEILCLATKVDHDI